MKVDAGGNKYEPTEIAMSFTNALNILYHEGEVTKEQCIALTKAVLEVDKNE